MVPVARLWQTEVRDRKKGCYRLRTFIGHMRPGGVACRSGRLMRAGMQFPAVVAPAARLNPLDVCRTLPVVHCLLRAAHGMSTWPRVRWGPQERREVGSGRFRREGKPGVASGETEQTCE